MIELNQDSGVVTLDGASLEGLLSRVAATAAGEPDDTGQSELWDGAQALESGIIDRYGQPAPVILPLLNTMARPWCLMRLTASRPTGPLSHQMRLGPRQATVLVDHGDGYYDLSGVAITWLPNVVAQLTGVGPRSTELPSSVTLPTAVVEPLFDPDVDASAAELAGHLSDPTIGALLARDAWTSHTIQTQWAPPLLREEPETSNHWHGWLSTTAALMGLNIDDQHAQLIPITPDELWRAIIIACALPSQVDLDSDYAQAASEPIMWSLL